MIDSMIEILKEYGVYLLTSTGIFFSIIFNRPKTAEKLKKIKDKKHDKLAKKGAKLAEKATAIYEQLNKEL